MNVLIWWGQPFHDVYQTFLKYCTILFVNYTLLEQEKIKQNSALSSPCNSSLGQTLFDLLHIPIMPLLGLLQVALPHTAFLPNVRHWSLFRALFTSRRAVTDNVLFILWKFWPFEMKQDWVGWVWQHVGKEGVWITKLRWAVWTTWTLERWRAGVWQKAADRRGDGAWICSKEIRG